MEARLDATPEDAWSALTDPARLARWFAEVDGDPRDAGEYRQRVLASGWEGAVRVDDYDPPRRLALHQTPDGDDVPETDVVYTLEDDGGRALVAVETRGMGRDVLFAYGAGWQIHLEDLADHLDGLERRAAEGRWDALEPVYLERARALP